VLQNCYIETIRGWNYDNILGDVGATIFGSIQTNNQDFRSLKQAREGSVKQYVEKSYSYKQYIELLDNLLVEGKTTGLNQSKAMFEYGKLNRQRMQRLSKTIELKNETKAAAQSARRKMIWLIITEGWCGDAAQNIPVIEKIASESVNIETRYILRDENTELMDQFLTEGARSIPKLIALDAETLNVLGTWGARPAPAQALFQVLKRQGVAKPLIMENLQRWYNDDRSHSIQNEFVQIIEQWGGNKSEKAGA